MSGMIEEMKSADESAPTRQQSDVATVETPGARGVAYRIEEALFHLDVAREELAAGKTVDREAARGNLQAALIYLGRDPEPVRRARVAVLEDALSEVAEILEAHREGNDLVKLAFAAAIRPLRNVNLLEDEGKSESVAEERCESGCAGPVVGYDPEGIPLCQVCLAASIEEGKREAFERALFLEIARVEPLPRHKHSEQHYFNDLLELTRYVDQHPDEYEGQCECKMCKGYEAEEGSCS